jgi:hypothetical protein
VPRKQFAAPVSLAAFSASDDFFECFLGGDLRHRASLMDSGDTQQIAMPGVNSILLAAGHGV